LVKINFHGGKNQFFSPCDTRTLPCWLRLHRWKFIFTVVEIDFLPWWEILISSNKFMTSSEITHMQPCSDFYHADFFLMEMEIHSINQMEIQKV